MKDEILIERIRGNEELFTEEELIYINTKFNLIKKVYILGLVDSREIYNKNVV